MEKEGSERGGDGGMGLAADERRFTRMKKRSQFVLFVRLSGKSLMPGLYHDESRVLIGRFGQVVGWEGN